MELVTPEIAQEDKEILERLEQRITGQGMALTEHDLSDIMNALEFIEEHENGAAMNFFDTEGKTAAAYRELRQDVDRIWQELAELQVARETSKEAPALPYEALTAFLPMFETGENMDDALQGLGDALYEGPFAQLSHTMFFGEPYERFHRPELIRRMNMLTTVHVLETLFIDERSQPGTLAKAVEKGTIALLLRHIDELQAIRG